MSKSTILSIHGAFDDISEYMEMRTDALLNILSKQSEDKNTNDYVLTVRKNSDDSFEHVKYFYNDKGKLQSEECEIRVMIKEKLRNRKKSFSQREKLDLLLEYISINKKRPDTDTIYKQCPIGKFANDANKWSEICEMINEAAPK